MIQNQDAGNSKQKLRVQWIDAFDAGRSEVAHIPRDDFVAQMQGGGSDQRIFAGHRSLFLFQFRNEFPADHLNRFSQQDKNRHKTPITQSRDVSSRAPIALP